MRILLIGHKGMLGNAVLDNYSSKYDVLGVDKDEVDIIDFFAVRRIMRNFDPSLVINCAAYTDVDGAEKDAELARAVNGDACGNLAHYCKEHDARFIHFSTDYVFDGTKEGGYDEDERKHLKPINVYGESKLAGEKLIADEAENYAIVRLSWLFGPGGKNFVDTMINLGRERDELRVVNDQFGKPTYTLDVAKALEWLFDDSKRGIFHLPNRGTTNWFEFAQEIFKNAKIDVKVEPIPTSEFPRPAARPKYSVLNNTKLSRMRSWEDALASYLGNSEKRDNMKII